MNIRDFFNENEQPLDRLLEGAGFCSVFRKVACIGDSLSSGEFEGTDENGNKTYHDMFEYSWGQFMARAAGFTVCNFSRGGMTASEYMGGYGAANGWFDKEKAAQAYIIALGVNDLYNRRDPVGVVADCETGAKTFAGYYGRLIKAYKGISPEAKFFLVTFPQEDRRADDALTVLGEAHRKLLYDFAEYFDNSYVIDLWQYAPVYDAAFRKQFFLGGHMSPAGYVFTAKMFLTYIDWIIRHNMQDFKQVGFIGTGLRNTVDQAIGSK